MGSLIVLNAIFLIAGCFLTFCIPIIPIKVKLIIFILLGFGIPLHFFYMLWQDFISFKRKLILLFLWLIVNIVPLYFAFVGICILWGTAFNPYFGEWQSWGG